MADKKELFELFQKEYQKHYELEVLKKYGFRRQKCKKCQKYFWAKAEMDYCQDSSCVGYRFIGNPPTKESLSYIQTWKKIEKYFTENGHKKVKPYPTVARWRDDIYFNIASIGGFQPYVVSGEIEPPANPLIIPQPCIRFGDLSNVGVTGRHYTNFVMVGQHAFNTQKTGLFYWKEEAIEHDIKYLKELGIDQEKITFKEDVWMGGGNFGPSMEYFCDGLELGNCVFMQYEIMPDGTYRELKTKVIDMGAGLSRLCWITNNSPTSYELVFGEVIKKMKEQAAIKIDQKIFLEYAKLSGSIDIEEGRTLDEQKKYIAKTLGMEEVELFSQLKELFSLYATADHINTLLHTITDGQLPSNAGGGYNLRLILRRAFGFNEEYEWNLDFGAIVEGHAKNLEELFPHLEEGVNTTIEVIGEELQKYRKSKKQALQKVNRIINTANKTNRQITLEDLITLYISDGIPPETVEAVAKEQGIEIKVPPDFYAKIRKTDEEETKIQTIDVMGIEKTLMLCYNNQIEFEAKVLAVKDNWVILDQTAFYPESGGQVSDDGTIEGKRVLEVRKEAGVILHKLENLEGIEVGKIVRGKIDAQRRRQIMAHHTGAHILNVAAREILGPHVWQCGAYKDEFKAHLDLTHYKKITPEELEKIELRANEIIATNLPIEKKIYPRDEAEAKFGFRIYQGGAVPGKELRIVSILDPQKKLRRIAPNVFEDGVDHQACGGTHLDYTGEAGLFKIVKKESIQEGVERVIFKCYLAAVEHIQKQQRVLKEVQEKLYSQEESITKNLDKIISEWKKRGKELEYWQEKYLDLIIEKEIQSAIAKNSKKIELKLDIEQKVADNVAKKIAQKGFDAIVENKEGFVVIALSQDSNLNAVELLNQFGVKGGGDSKIARGKRS
ncbi:MAG: alanine--tRNA ligase [Candidatus Anstonellaceae archaeon]